MSCTTSRRSIEAPPPPLPTIFALHITELLCVFSLLLSFKPCFAFWSKEATRSSLCRGCLKA